MYQISNQSITMHGDRQMLTTKLFDQDLESGIFPNPTIYLVDLVLGFRLTRNFPKDLRSNRQGRPPVLAPVPQYPR